MGFYILLYYILNLIKAGHEWQYQNATKTNCRPKLYFTLLQWIAIGLSLLFLFKNPLGFTRNLIDTLLSSLSILTGFFLALLVYTYDKYNDIDYTCKNYSEKIKEYKTKNYLLQFHALTSYAVFISIILIIALVSILLWGKNTLLSDYCLASSWHNIDWLLTIKLFFVVIVRILLVYFIFDFFILSLYAICSLFQFVNVKANKQNIDIEINMSLVESDRKTLKKAFPHYIIICLISLIFLVGLIIYIVA